MGRYPLFGLETTKTPPNDNIISPIKIRVPIPAANANQIKLVISINGRDINHTHAHLLPLAA
jgi:hypothetical protein